MSNKEELIALLRAGNKMKMDKRAFEIAEELDKLTVRIEDGDLIDYTSFKEVQDKLRLANEKLDQHPTTFVDAEATKRYYDEMVKLLERTVPRLRNYRSELFNRLKTCDTGNDYHNLAIEYANIEVLLNDCSKFV